MQIEPLVVQLANVSRVVAIKIDLQFMTKAAQIILRQFQCRFGQEQCGEVLLHQQGDLADLIVILSVRLRRLRARTIQAPPPLLPALEKPVNAHIVGIRTGWIIGRERNVATGQVEIRIGPHTGLHLLPFHGEQVLLRCQQDRVVRQSLLHRLLHGDGRRGNRRSLRIGRLASG